MLQLFCLINSLLVSDSFWQFHLKTALLLEGVSDYFWAQIILLLSTQASIS